MNIKPIVQPPPLRGKLARLSNHFFLLVGLLFVAQLEFSYQPATPGEEEIVQALHLQPRTPPPSFDIDQVSDTYPDGQASIEPVLAAESTMPSHKSDEPSGASAATERVAEPILTRADAPDREARALPRTRPE